MWPSREEDTMTTPRTAEVGHGSTQEQRLNYIGSLRRAAFTRFKQFAIVTVFVSGAAMGYGGVEYDASAAQLALSPDLHDLRRAFRHATAIYHDTDRLERNGWVRLQETCFEEDAGTTRLGIVFVNPSRIDGVIHPAQPEVLYYEPQSDGDLKLMGGEYFCPVEACPTPPTLFNQTFRFEEDTNGHALHVWAWLSNPNGLTHPANPNVDTTYCP
jgi:hypothetical protein